MPTQFTICLPEGGDTVSASLHSLVDSSVVKCEVTKLEQGRYQISVLPLARGRHELRIGSGSHYIDGSPFPVFVYCPPQLLGKPIRILEGVGHPAGVAIRGNSELIITETEPAEVSVWSKEGKKLRQFEQGASQFDNPYGVAIDSEGSVYVAELINCRIHKFSQDGTLLKAIGASSQLGFPAGIKISPDDRVFVCDDTNQKVHVFNRELELLFSFGEAGDKPGQFMSPSDLAFDNHGSVFVADTKRERIMNFSLEGEFRNEFEVKGQSAELELGMCISSSGYVCVSDFWNNRVVVFRTTGEFVTAFGREGSRPGEFDEPAGIAVDEDGFVYVCDQRNNRVQVF